MGRDSALTVLLLFILFSVDLFCLCVSAELHASLTKLTIMSLFSLISLVGEALCERTREPIPRHVRLCMAYST
jgi:LytS/YehU family sensor histidine kinase